MNNLKNLYVIVGKSGSGKSSIVKRLCEVIGLKMVKSYTTRPMRKGESIENSDHTFTTKENLDLLHDIVTYDTIDENIYCATKEQIDNSNFYIINPSAIEDLKNKYKDKQIFVIDIFTEKYQCVYNMKLRGDSLNEIQNRIKYDAIEFQNERLLSDFVIKNTPSKTVDILAVELLMLILELEAENI